VLDRVQFERGLEQAVLVLVLALLIAATLAFGGVGDWQSLLVQGLAAAAIGTWGVLLLVRRRVEWLWPPACWIVLAFVLYALARYLTADIERVARLEFLRVLIYAGVFFLTLNALHSQTRVVAVVTTLIVLGVIESAYAGYQFLANDNRVWGVFNPYRERGSGTYICPNHLAGYLEMVLPLATAYLLVARNRVLVKILAGYAAVMMMAGLAFTASRAGWLAACAGMLALVLVLLRYRSFRVPAAVLLGLLLASGLLAVHRHTFNEGKFGLKYSLDHLARDVRGDLWHSAWRMWQDHPTFGVGPGHFDARFRQYRPDGVQMRPDRVHNDYLNMLTDYGAVGGTLMAALLVAGVLAVIRMWPHVCRAKKDFGNPLTNKFAFVLGASAGLFGLALHSAVDFNLHIPANALLAAVLLALLFSHLRYTTRSYWFRLEGARRWLVAGPALGVALVLAWQWLPLARQQLALRAAARAAPLSLERKAALQRAFQADPHNADLAFELGELHRAWAWNQMGDDEAHAAEAMRWHEQAMRLNPFDPNPRLRYAMCLDWLERSGESLPWYQQADALDPNNYFIAAGVGWHYLHTGDYAAARFWLERSLKLQREDNPRAASDLSVVQARLAEQAGAPAAKR
jgi:O-antigen ligase